MAACQSVDEVFSNSMELNSIFSLSLQIFFISIRDVRVVSVGLELIHTWKSESETSFSFGSNWCALNIILFAKNLFSFKNYSVDLPSSERGMGKDTVDAWYLKSPNDKLDAKHEDGG